MMGINCSAMLFNDSSRHRQTDAKTFVFFLGARGVAAIEAIEQARQRFIAQGFLHDVFRFQNDILTRFTQ